MILRNEVEGRSGRKGLLPRRGRSLFLFVGIVNEGIS